MVTLLSNKPFMFSTTLKINIFKKTIWDPVLT